MRLFLSGGELESVSFFYPYLVLIGGRKKSLFFTVLINDLSLPLMTLIKWGGKVLLVSSAQFRLFFAVSQFRLFSAVSPLFLRICFRKSIDPLLFLVAVTQHCKRVRPSVRQGLFLVEGK